MYQDAPGSVSNVRDLSRPLPQGSRSLLCDRLVLLLGVGPWIVGETARRYLVPASVSGEWILAAILPSPNKGHRRLPTVNDAQIRTRATPWFIAVHKPASSRYDMDR
jgi:hypothetical protein